MILMSTFLAVKALLEKSVPKKTIARRLGIDPRTVRKYEKRIAAGETEPVCHRPKDKLYPHTELIKSKVLQGLSYTQIYQDLLDEVSELVASLDEVSQTSRARGLTLLPLKKTKASRVMEILGDVLD